MNAVAVPTIPPAILYMIDPPHGRVRGKTLLSKLYKCSREHNNCRDCDLVAYCGFYHDFLIETDAITNWKGANENVTRYY